MLAKKEFVILCRDGRIAYIQADKADDVLASLQKDKYIRVSDDRIINTADISDVMTPNELEDQRRFQRGWYQKDGYWYNKQGEKCEMTREEKAKPQPPEPPKKQVSTLNSDAENEIIKYEWKVHNWQVMRFNGESFDKKEAQKDLDYLRGLVKNFYDK